jgi:DNA-binding LytR/AlgR family response regulator
MSDAAMRALVVDDEPLVRSELVYALGKVARDVEVSEAPDAIEALRELAAAHFDVVFLDINLPGLSGLEATRVINAMPAAPQVVFVTAHDTHAVDAFELAAFDYVVKPVSQDRLARTIERLRSSRSSAAGVAPAQGTLARVALEDGERTRLAKVAEIRYVQANGHVVTARLFDGDLRWKGSLAEAAARLEPAGFLRVHRAYLVNPERVVEVEPFFGGSYLLRVDDKTRSEVPVSRNYLPAVRKALGL